MISLPCAEATGVELFEELCQVGRATAKASSTMASVRNANSSHCSTRDLLDRLRMASAKNRIADHWIFWRCCRRHKWIAIGIAIPIPQSSSHGLRKPNAKNGGGRTPILSTVSPSLMIGSLPPRQEERQTDRQWVIRHKHLMFDF